MGALKGQFNSARISRKEGALDSRLRRTSELDVDNQNGELLPGMVAEVNLSLKCRNATFVVPKLSVIQ